MTDTEKKQTAGPQVMLRGLLVVVALAVVAGLGLYLWQRSHQAELEGPQQVAMLDADAIYALPEFTAAKAELEKLDKDYRAQLEKAIKDKKVKDAKEAEAYRLQMRQKLETEQARRLKPLNDRVSVAIATIASQKKYRVVLDKKIVVTGVVDITEDVKKQFAQTKPGDAPKSSAAETESHVGYINEETVSELKMFKLANAQLAADYQKMGVAYVTKSKNMKPADKEKLRSEMAQQFQDLQKAVFKPINDNVNAAITQVAKEKGLSLVLNSHHIMWGGRNLTDDVIKKLVQVQAKS